MLALAAHLQSGWHLAGQPTWSSEECLAPGVYPTWSSAEWLAPGTRPRAPQSAWHLPDLELLVAPAHRVGWRWRLRQLTIRGACPNIRFLFSGVQESSWVVQTIGNRRRCAASAHRKRSRSAVSVRSKRRKPPRRSNDRTPREAARLAASTPGRYGLNLALPRARSGLHPGC